MKFVSSFVTLIGLLLLLSPAHAQISIYGQYGATNLPGGPNGDYLYGPAAAGLIYDLSAPAGVNISGDLRYSYVQNDGESLQAIEVGPRVAYTFKRLKLRPYGEFLFGIGRYHDGKGFAISDSYYGGYGGVEHKLKGRFAWRVFEFGYSYFGTGINDSYQSKSYSTGILVHIK